MEIETELENRIKMPELMQKICTAEEACCLIEDGMTVAVSGFSAAGDPKAVPRALAARARQMDHPLKIDLVSGASVGPAIDTELTEAEVICFRYPYMTDRTLRHAVDHGAVRYVDDHLSQTAQRLADIRGPKVDLAIVEVCAIESDGSLILTSSVGNTPEYLERADQVILELALAQPLGLRGMHDCVYDLAAPLGILHPMDRIGTPGVLCDPDKIKAIVVTDEADDLRPLREPDEISRKIAGNIISFLQKEVALGRMTPALRPIQSGVGAVANAVLYGLQNSEFRDLTCYTEVVQDSMLDLLRCGKVTGISTTAISPSPDGKAKFDREIDRFHDKIILRPQYISNHPEVIRRLGVISLNTALEMDIYGNVNSTHVNGSHMMNGIGGAGDFSRNAGITIFSTPATAKQGMISSIVPMCSHVDHTEHEVMVVVTEYGYADLRGLTPKERARKIIDHCAAPEFREQLNDYFARACEHCHYAQTPHILREALSWHVRAEETGSMMP